MIPCRTQIQGREQMAQSDPGWMWLVPDHPGKPVEEEDTENLLPKAREPMMANPPFPLLALRHTNTLWDAGGPNPPQSRVVDESWMWK